MTRRARGETMLYRAIIEDRIGRDRPRRGRAPGFLSPDTVGDDVGASNLP
jgi:hypothetical protein